MIKTISRKKNKAGGIMLPDCELYYKTTVIKQHGTGKKKKKTSRHIALWNKIKSAEINPHLNGQLIYDKGGKKIQ